MLKSVYKGKRSAIITILVGMCISGLVLLDLWIDGCIADFHAGVTICGAEAQSSVKYMVPVIAVGTVLIATYFFRKNKSLELSK